MLQVHCFGKGSIIKLGTGSLQVHVLHILDSKVLTEERRDELFKALSCMEETLGWKVEVLSPNAISNAMLQR